MYRQGLRAYWLDMSNWYDWPSLLGFGVIAYIRYKTWEAMRPIKQQVADDAVDGSIDGVIDFHAAGSWVETETQIMAVEALLVYLKVRLTRPRSRRRSMGLCRLLA